MSNTMSSANHQPGPPSEMLESRQAAIKNRIITHLNADHAFSLQCYIRHFCGVPEKQASNAKITDMTCEHMIIESRAGRNLIMFDPPMKSLMEARERTVALHHQAVAGLGLSDIKIQTFHGPNKLWQMGTVGIIVWCMATLPFRSKLPAASGSIISQVYSFGGTAPWIADLAYTLGPFTLLFISVVHSLEAENFARTRLRKHRMPTGSPVWCLWVVYAWFGGLACFTRFDELVKQKEEASKKNEQH